MIPPSSSLNNKIIYTQNLSNSPPLINPTSLISPSDIESDRYFPTETPLDKERHAAFVAKIIDACCVLNPAIAIDRETVLRCLNACVNDELSARCLSSVPVNLRQILRFALNAQNTDLPIESFFFAGSSVVYKLADAIVQAIQASEAKELITPLFLANLKRKPHDSDWKIVIQNPPKDSKISFWDNVEAYTRAILCEIALKKGRDLPKSFDIPAVCLELGIDYEAVQGQFIHISFRDCGIDLTIGRFEKGGLFKDTLPEISIIPSSLTEDPADLKTELCDNGTSIFQAALFRGYKVLAVDSPKSKNDRALVQYIRRSLNGDACFSEADYPAFMDTLFKSYPVGPSWGKDIAKKFCNINKGHSDAPVQRIIWSMFLFLSSLNKFPQYPVPLLLQSKAWKCLPLCCFPRNEKSKGILFHLNPFYRFILESKLPCDMLEGVLGIAGLLSLSFASRCENTSYSISRHHGSNHPALYLQVEEDLQIALNPDLLTLCHSLEEHYTAFYSESIHTGKLLDLFLSFVSLPETNLAEESVIARNAQKLPCSLSDTAALAHKFVLSTDSFLNVVGTSILVALKAYDADFVDESLLCYAFPVLLNSSDPKIKDFGIRLAKKHLSALAQKDAPPFLHPKTQAFSLPLWLNALALTKHPRCCEIAAKHWVINLKAEKRSFQAYLPFMENIWKVQPSALLQVWESLLPHDFDTAQQKQLFAIYADRFLTLPAHAIALDCLKPFLFYIQSCLENFTVPGEGARLHALVQRISEVKPTLLPLCLPFLPFLPLDALPLFKMGTIDDILQGKIAEAKTAEDKTALYQFIRQNIRLPGIFFTLIGTPLQKVLEGTEYLPDLHELFIQEASKSQRQKAHILLKLFNKAPEKIQSMQDSITAILKDLMEDDNIPLELILQVFNKCYSYPNRPAGEFLLEPLCHLGEKLLTRKLNSLTPVVRLICTHDSMLLRNKTDLLSRLLRRLAHENDPDTFEITMQLIQVLKNGSTLPISMWESLIHKLKLAAVHHDSVNRHHKLKEFVQTLPELRQLCCQLDLDLLAHRISTSPSNAEDHAKLLIAKQHELTPTQIQQLHFIVQRMIAEMTIHSPIQATTWIKSSIILEFFSLDERIRCSCILLQNHFDSSLFFFVLQMYEGYNRKVHKDILEPFAVYLLKSTHLFYECRTPEEKAKRLLLLPPCRNGNWYEHIHIVLNELIQEKKITACTQIFRADRMMEQLSVEMNEIFNTLFTLVPQDDSNTFRELLELVLKTPTILKNNVWKICLARIPTLKDKKLTENLLSSWITCHPLPPASELEGAPLLEKELHYRAIVLACTAADPFKAHFFMIPESVMVLLRNFTSDAKVSTLQGIFLTHLLSLEDLSTKMSYIQAIIENLSMHSDSLHCVFSPLCHVLAATLKEKQTVLAQIVFGKINVCIDLCSDPKSKTIILKNKTALSLAIQNIFNNSLQQDIHELLNFISKVKELLTVEDPVWVTVLQWLVQHHEPLIMKSEKTFYDLLFLILTSISMTMNKQERLKYSSVFGTPEFSSLMKNICRNIYQIDRTKSLTEFLFTCLQLKLIPSEIVLESSCLIPKKTASDTNCIEALEHNLKSACLYCHESIMDNIHILAAIDSTLMLFTVNKDIKNFEHYAKRLLNFAFYDPTVEESEHFRFIVMPGQCPPILGSDTKQKPFNTTRFITCIYLFLNRLQSNEFEITSEAFLPFARTIVLLLYAHIIMSDNKKLESNERAAWLHALMKFVLLPRSIDANESALMNSYLEHILEIALSSNFLVRKSVEFEAPDFYRKLCNPFEKTDIFNNISNIRLLAQSCAQIAPRSYLNFLEQIEERLRLFSYNYDLPSSISLCQTLLLPLKQMDMPSQYKSLCIHCIKNIMESCVLLKCNFTLTFDETVRMSLIKLKSKYLYILIDIHLSNRKHSLEVNLENAENSIAIVSYAYVRNNFKYIFAAESRLLLVHAAVNTLTNILSSGSNSKQIFKYFIKIGRLLLNFTYSSAQLKAIKEQAFFECFLDFFANPSVFATLKNENNPRISDMITLLIRSFNFCLNHAPDKQKIVCSIKKIISLKGSALSDPVLYYIHFNEQVYSYIPQILNNPSEINFEKLSAELTKVRCYQEGEMTDEKAGMFTYHLLYCCQLRSMLTPDEASVLDPIILELIHSVLNLKKSFDPFVHLFGFLIENGILLKNNTGYFIILTALEDMSPYEEKFRILFVKATHNQWFCGDQSRDRKNKIIETYLNGINPGEKLVLTDNSKLRNYVLNLWEVGNFTNYELLETLITSSLPPAEAAKLLKFGIKKALAHQKYTIAISFVILSTAKKILEPDSTLVRHASAMFLFAITKHKNHISIFNDFINTPLINILIKDNLIGLRKQLFQSIKTFGLELSSDHLIKLLKFYKKAWLQELKLNPLLMEVEDNVNELTSLQDILNTFIEFHPASRLEVEFWIVDFLHTIKVAIPAEDYPKVILDFVMDSLKLSQLSSLHYISEVSILEYLQDLPETSFYTCQGCTYFSTFLSKKKCTDDNFKVQIFLIGINIARRAVKMGYYDETIPVMKTLNVRMDNPNLNAWSNKWIQDLLYLKEVFFCRKMLRESLICFELLVLNSPQYIRPEEKQHYYSVAYSMGEYLLAARVATKYGLWGAIDIPKLIEKLIVITKTPNELNIVLEIFKNQTIRSTHLVLKLLALLQKSDVTANSLRHYLEFLEEVEVLEPLSPPSLRRNAWNLAIGYLAIIEIPHAFISLKVRSLNCAFLNEEERIQFQVQQLVVSLRDHNYTQNNLQYLLSLRTSIKLCNVIIINQMKVVDDALIHLISKAETKETIFHFVKFLNDMFNLSFQNFLPIYQNLMLSATLKKGENFFIKAPKEFIENDLLKLFNNSYVFFRGNFQSIYNLLRNMLKLNNNTTTERAFILFQEVIKKDIPSDEEYAKDAADALKAFSEYPYDYSEMKTKLESFHRICKIRVSKKLMSNASMGKTLYYLILNFFKKIPLEDYLRNFREYFVIFEKYKFTLSTTIVARIFLREAAINLIERFVLSKYDPNTVVQILIPVLNQLSLSLCTNNLILSESSLNDQPSLRSLSNDFWTSEKYATAHLILMAELSTFLKAKSPTDFQELRQFCLSALINTLKDSPHIDILQALINMLADIESMDVIQNATDRMVKERQIVALLKLNHKMLFQLAFIHFHGDLTIQNLKILNVTEVTFKDKLQAINEILDLWLQNLRFEDISFIVSAMLNLAKSTDVIKSHPEIAFRTVIKIIEYLETNIQFTWKQEDTLLTLLTTFVSFICDKGPIHPTQSEVLDLLQNFCDQTAVKFQKQSVSMAVKSDLLIARLECIHMKLRLNLISPKIAQKLILLLIQDLEHMNLESKCALNRCLEYIPKDGFIDSYLKRFNL
ncbi:MAG: hypothetical protein WC222_08305 [Parachlamydiales bacterium]|jgi:hypothetical protein